MKKQVDIGSLYREAFRDYQPAPPPGLAEKTLDKAGAARKLAWQSRFTQPMIWTAGVVIMGVTAFLLWPEEKSPAVPEDLVVVQDTQVKLDIPANITIVEEAVPQEESTSDLNVQDLTEKVPSTIEKDPIAAAQNVPDADVRKKTAVPSERPISESSPSPIPRPADKQEPKKAAQDTPVSASDRHRITRVPRDTAAIPEVVLSETQYICKGEGVSIGASGGVSYLWNTGEKSQTIHVKPLTSMPYRVTVTRPDRRKIQGEIWVNVEDCATLYVPNAFTPNGDGLNDEFKAYGKRLTYFHIQIYDGTGTVLFESSDIEEAWDGQYVGAPVETGHYFYRITYADPQNTRQTRNGRITLLR